MIKCKLIDKGCMPIKKHTNDAGFDLKSRVTTGIMPMETIKIPVGVCIDIPVGYEGAVRPRSSVSLQGLLVHEGTIDCGYTGEISIIVTNLSNKPCLVCNGDRIAQIVFNKIHSADVLIEVEELPKSARGDKGFGSSGI